MSGVQRATLRFPAKAVLAALWYSDGSGGMNRVGSGIHDTDEAYRIVGIALEGDQVVIEIEATQ